MKAELYTSVRAGGVVTPDVPSTVSPFEISLASTAKKASRYGLTSKLLTAQFWPLNTTTTPGSASRNMLSLPLRGGSVQSVEPHAFWYCYGGWNQSGVDLDGDSIVGVYAQPNFFALYNCTPYVLSWQVTDSKLASPDSFASGLRLLPGCSAVVEGPVTGCYYNTGSAFVYDAKQGPVVLGSWLHVQAIDNRPHYSPETGVLFNGYLEVLIGQGATQYWMP